MNIIHRDIIGYWCWMLHDDFLGVTIPCHSPFAVGISLRSRFPSSQPGLTRESRFTVCCPKHRGVFLLNILAQTFHNFSQVLPSINPLIHHFPRFQPVVFAEIPSAECQVPCLQGHRVEVLCCSALLVVAGLESWSDDLSDGVTVNQSVCQPLWYLPSHHPSWVCHD